MQSKAIYYRGINWTKHRAVEKKGEKIYDISQNSRIGEFCTISRKIISGYVNIWAHDDGKPE